MHWIHLNSARIILMWTVFQGWIKYSFIFMTRLTWAYSSFESCRNMEFIFLIWDETCWRFSNIHRGRLWKTLHFLSNYLSDWQDETFSNCLKHTSKAHLNSIWRIKERFHLRTHPVYIYLQGTQTNGEIICGQADKLFASCFAGDGSNSSKLFIKYHSNIPLNREEIGEYCKLVEREFNWIWLCKFVSIKASSSAVSSATTTTQLSALPIQPTGAWSKARWCLQKASSKCCAKTICSKRITYITVIAFVTSKR